MRIDRLVSRAADDAPGAVARFLLVLAAAGLAGCAAVARDPAAPANGAAPDADSVVPGEVAPAEDDGLPPGRGAAILRAACTDCHNLGGLWAYKGYYNEQRWRGLVQTMIAHGANLDETATNELVDYLVLHFGPGSR